MRCLRGYRKRCRKNQMELKIQRRKCTTIIIMPFKRNVWSLFKKQKTKQTREKKVAGYIQVIQTILQDEMC
jgi:hypothetical protein